MPTLWKRKKVKLALSNGDVGGGGKGPYLY